jgi:Tfp pilus assembly protein PilX
MRAKSKWLCNERGLVLYNSLLILSLLVTLGVGARVMLQSDSKTLANMRGSTEAFYLAESGIEWGKDEISKNFSHPPNLSSGTQNFWSGNFSVSFLSPTVVTPLVARIVVRSTGAVSNSSQTVQAQVTKTYDLADGAVSLRGSANRLGFAGTPLLISGLDYDPATAQAVAGSQGRPAISVSDEILKGLVEQEVSNNQQTGNVGSGGALPAVAESSFLPGSAVTRLANELCGSVQAVTTYVSSDGVLSLESQTWGTRAAPQLRCIEGLAGPGDSVNLGGGLTGAGILVVKNSELIVSGSLRWEGLILVTGDNVGFKVAGADNKEVYGSLMVNETGTPGTATAILDIQGSVKVLFSRPALARVVTLVPSSTLAATYSALPSMISQEYWRTVTP